ncbi:prolyl oligopeptidase family serine peptidase [Parapedobacter deserti]|uniref:Prolyl oligopeptidase family serine peptidase n=1 Tax=Parapedobacter deserti TaxID=1912957 RepID=A0ABV7JKT2_9SPHI
MASAQKKSLDNSAYDGWQSISASAISKDGRFIYYIITPQEGDSELVVTTAQNEQLVHIARATNASFSPDGKFLISFIKPFYSEIREAKIKKKKPDEMPKDSLAIFALETSELYKIPRVKSYKSPAEAGEYIAFITEPPSLKDSTAADSNEAKRSVRKKPQPTLHVRHLTSSEEITFERVDSYFFSDNGKTLVYIRTPEEKDSIFADAGLYHLNLPTLESKQISRGKGEYKNIAFDKTASQLAFTADKSHEKSLQKNYNLYYYTPGQDSAIIIAHSATAGIPTGWEVSRAGEVRFSKSGEKLYFNIAPTPRVKDTTLVEFEHANVDIWHWKDDYLQTQQLVNLKREQSRSYLAVTYPAKGRKVISLADEQVPYTRISEDADNEFVLATTDVGRRIETQWQTGAFQDIYLVSTLSGTRKKIAENIRGSISLSPTGNYAIWFNRSDSNWYSHDIRQDKTVLLNTDLPVSFADEDNDVPDAPNGYGIAGWSEGDEEVLINDKYDIWAFRVDGTGRRLITNGAGRSNKITFRYRDLTEDNGRMFRRAGGPTVIDTKKPTILSAFNHISKESGWYTTLGRNNRDPKEITMGPYRYGQVKRAEDVDQYIYTKENYASSPDLYLSKDLLEETKLSSINPQQQQYNWGTAELIRWTTPKGYAAEGILYKPEDFDPNKKYPVIAYFYETLSDGLYNYVPPTPTPSRLNISFFVSNGYIVLAPDIRYEIGYPGRSAEEYVNSGMEELKKQPWVDSGKLAIQGQSWGGYQVAHLITRTDMYAAAWAGAPVVNMTSAYGGIRWESGMNRQFQYEHTQSRIGATLWEKPELYIENSPLFHLPNVSTPVVIMHNDEDGAVPWYQGIEMFTALRRLQKPVWLLNYNGEAHNLVQRQNRKDIQRRQLEFFDHFLKGKSAAPWIENGVPAILKGIDWGFGDQNN